MAPLNRRAGLSLVLVCFYLTHSGLFQCNRVEASPLSHPDHHVERHLLMLADEPDKKDAASVDVPNKPSDKDDDGQPDDDLESDEEKFEHKDDSDDDKDDDEKDVVVDDDDVKSQADKKLLVILLDGFRHDYVERDVKALKGLPRLANEGVHARKVKPVHPSASYPNYYSIVTGLYAESHGFVDNLVRDKSSGQLFLGHPHANASARHWWDDAEPLWVTAEKHRIKAAVYGWPGCEVASSNTKRRPQPSICVPYEKMTSKAERKLLRHWLEKIVLDFGEHRYRLAMVYHESIDATGHKYGPQSRVTKQAVRDVDEIIYDLQDMLIKHELADEVNVYLVSDHGMISTKGFVPIQLERLIDLNDVELVLGEGATVQLLAEKGKHSQIVRKLSGANTKGLNVYEKNTLPERFHLRNNKNLLPIYLTCDEGYYITTPDIKNKIYPDDVDESEANEDHLPKGAHGYDAEFVDEMQTIMYASGPDIRDRVGIDEMEQVDHYNVLCDLLSVKPKANNGSVAILARVLTKHAHKDSEEGGHSGEDDSNQDNSGEEENDAEGEHASAIFIHCLLLAMLTMFTY